MSSAAPAPDSSASDSRAGGLFLAFEGGDGAGKSTQVHLLAQALRATGREVLTTRQPGGTALGERLRDLVLHGEDMGPRAEALLFAADKAHHVEQLIAPALAASQVVITDRYTDSSVAYQGAGRALGAREVAALQMWAVGDLAPEVTVVVDVPPQEGRRRRGEVHDRLEAETDAFHAAIREHFLAMAAAAPQRYLVVDGTGSIETIHHAVLTGLRAKGVIPG